MNKIITLSLIIGLIAVSCTDPNTIGLEIQPTSDNIIISDTSSFSWQTSQVESEDSLRTDEALNLILGEINDPVFGYNQGTFNTQILLTENNSTLGENPIVDSIILSYTYSGYYGVLDEFTNLEVKRINDDIYKDSIYYSNEYEFIIGSATWTDTFSLSNDSETPFLKIKLTNDFGQQILNLGDDLLKDNETFLQEFKGLSVLASATNTILYLNPDGSNSFMKIYYHNDESGSDTLSLDFEWGGDAARVNWFSPKQNSVIIDDQSKIYIQSMAGYKAKISINNIDSLKALLEGKAINKVTMSFDVEIDPQDEYTAPAHDKLFLVRVDQEGNSIFLTDFIVEGETYFGGRLEDYKYEFNITNYFSNLLKDDLYTNDLYLLPAGAAVNANRTILNKNIKLQIYYSEL